MKQGFCSLWIMDGYKYLGKYTHTYFEHPKYEVHIPILKRVKVH